MASRFEGPIFMSINTVFYHNGGSVYDDGSAQEPAGWYFWTETLADYVGPYASEAQAARMQKEYAESL